MACATFDVVIIGGGPAGCATAIALHNLGVTSILVAEASDYSNPRIGESIPPNTRSLLSRLGLWRSFEREGHEMCLGSYSSWGSDRPGYNDFLFNPRGLGWHLDRLSFDQFLSREMLLRDIELRTCMRFHQIHCDSETFPFNLTFAEHDPVRCRFVVDASGRGAKVARRLGATRKVEDNLICIAAYYKAPDAEVASVPSPTHMTLLEAVEYGWWYSARLPGGRIIVAVSSDPDIILRRHLKQPLHWHAALLQTQRVMATLGECAAPEQLYKWVAPSALLNPPAAAGWLAAGDAASSFDPISSQGIYKALLHGINAAPAIVSWLSGDSQLLSEYRQSIGEEFVNYLEQRTYFYDLEQRWPDSEFWKKRHQGQREFA